MQTDNLRKVRPVLCLDEVPVLKMVIAYDDFAHGMCALHFLESLIADFGEMFTFVPRFLKFEELLRWDVAEQVSKEAAEADLNVIAAHEEWELPALVKKWLRTWKGNTVNEDGAFVALLSTPPRTVFWRRPVEAHLRKVALRTKRTFLCNQIEWPRKDVSFSVEIKQRLNGHSKSSCCNLQAK